MTCMYDLNFHARHFMDGFCASTKATARVSKGYKRKGRQVATHRLGSSADRPLGRRRQTPIASSAVRVISEGLGQPHTIMRPRHRPSISVGLSGSARVPVRPQKAFGSRRSWDSVKVKREKCRSTRGAAPGEIPLSTSLHVAKGWVVHDRNFD